MNWNDLSMNDQTLYERIAASELYRSGDIASVFNIFRTVGNQSSYEMLVSGVSDLKRKNVLDVPCGSGPLAQLVSSMVGPEGHVIGVDFNGDEIKKAQDSIKQKNIQFLCEKAQDLSIAENSIDVVFCHLGLMLFHPLEPVIKSMSRVLRHGGIFVANLISSEKRSAVFEEYCKISHAYEAHIPKVKQFSWGDPRVGTMGGLNELFNAKYGFSSVIEKTYYTVGHQDTSEAMLKLLRTFFQISYLLEEEDRIKCEKELLMALERFKDKNGQVSFEIPFEKVTVRKI